jgi:hypothetical protein
VQNPNPVQLDSGGFATIYGSGSYREIVQDNAGNVVYDQLTADTSSAANSWAGAAGGTANAITLSAANFSAQDGQTISFISSAGNTGPVTVTIGANVYQLTEEGDAGPIALQGGEIQPKQVVTMTYIASSGTFVLNNPANNNQFITIASSSTTDLGSTSYTNVTVSGNASITSFGSSASIYFPLYFVTFTGNATINYNATSLLTPGNRNIVTQAGGLAIMQYLGSGNWQVLQYFSPVGRTRQVLTSGNSATYTTPSGVSYLSVRQCGAGGGGGGAGTTTSGGTGGTGGTTTFGSFTTIGGSGGGANSTLNGGAGGAGGTGGVGTGTPRIPGAVGAPGISSVVSGNTMAPYLGGQGGASPFGGAGASASVSAAANSCSGGGGAGSVNGAFGNAGGGGAGEYAEYILVGPSATITYTIGAAGAAGTIGSGTNASAGGAGGSGIIIVDEYYN